LVSAVLEDLEGAVDLPEMASSLRVWMMVACLLVLLVCVVSLDAEDAKVGKKRRSRGKKQTPPPLCYARFAKNSMTLYTPSTGKCIRKGLSTCSNDGACDSDGCNAPGSCFCTQNGALNSCECLQPYTGTCTKTVDLDGANGDTGDSGQWPNCYNDPTPPGPIGGAAKYYVKANGACQFSLTNDGVNSNGLTCLKDGGCTPIPRNPLWSKCPGECRCNKGTIVNECLCLWDVSTLFNSKAIQCTNLIEISPP